MRSKSLSAWSSDTWASMATKTRPTPTNQPGSASRAPRFPQLREVAIPTRSFESERLCQIRRFIHEPTKGVDRLAFRPQAIPAHHLIYEAIIKLHSGAHSYAIVHSGHWVSAPLKQSAVAV